MRSVAWLVLGGTVAGACVEPVAAPVAPQLSPPSQAARALPDGEMSGALIDGRREGIWEVRFGRTVVELHYEAGSRRDISIQIVSFGVDACDEYVSFYARCVRERVPWAEQENVLFAVARSMEVWREVAADGNRDAAERACVAATQTAAVATREAFGCQW